MLLQRWDLGTILAELVILVLFFVTLIINGGGAGRYAASLMLGGPYTAVFWGVVVIAGRITPRSWRSWRSGWNAGPHGSHPS